MSAAVRLHSLTLLPLTDNHPPSEQALSRHVLCTKLLVLFIQDTSLSRTLTTFHRCSGPDNGFPASTPNLWDHRDIGTPRYPCRRLVDHSYTRPYNYPLPYRPKPPLLAPMRCNEVGERRYAPRRLDCPSTQRFPPDANFKPNNATIQSEQYKTLTGCLSTIPSDSHIATSLKWTTFNVLYSPRHAPTDFFPSFQPH